MLMLIVSMLQLYVTPDNKQSDHVDFKKALDLVECVPAPEEDLRELRQHIFAMSVLRDDWSKLDVDNPADSVKDTVFFKLAEFCYIQVRKTAP